MTRHPFRFHSSTLTGFVLLICMMLAVPTIWRPTLVESLTGGHLPPSPWIVAKRDCLADKACLAQWCALPGHGGKPAALGECLPAILGKVAVGGWNPPADIVLTLLTLGLLTVGQYWLTPAWRIRRRRLRPVHRAGSRALLTELSQIVDRIPRLDHDDGTPGSRVHFLVDIVNPAVAGLAFGHVFRRYVVLSRGMLDLFDRDRSLFRAVVLHELAHVRNLDLDITGFTVAMWRSFVFVMIVPGLLDSAAGIAHDPASMPAWILAAQLVGLTGVAWLARGTVLRSRELHADARAMTWLPDPGSLRRLLTTSSRRRSLAGLLRGTHPNLVARSAVMADGDLLMRQGFAFPFVVGACFSLLWDSTTALSVGYLYQFYWITPFLAIVLTYTLANRALRASDGLRARPALRAADGLAARLGLAAGLPVGWALSPSRLADHTMASFPVSLQVAEMLILAGAGWLLGTWTEWVMGSWARARADPLERFWLAPLMLIGLVVFGFAGSVYGLHAFAIAAAATGNPTLTQSMALVLLDMQAELDHAGTLFLPFLVLALMVIPLVGPVIRRQHSVPPAQTPLAAARRICVAAWRQIEHATPARYGSHPRHAALVCTLAAVIAGALAGVCSTPASHLLPAPDSANPNLYILTSVLGAALAAATAAWVRTAPVVRALLVTLGGAAMCLALSATVMPVAHPVLVLSRALEAGLLAAAAVAALRSATRRRIPDPAPTEPIDPPGQPWATDPVDERATVTVTRRSVINTALSALGDGQPAPPTSVTITSARGLVAMTAREFTKGFAFAFVFAVPTLYSIMLMGLAIGSIFHALFGTPVYPQVLWTGWWFVLLGAGFFSCLIGLARAGGGGGLRKLDVITVDAAALAVAVSLRSGTDHALRLQWEDLRQVSVVGAGRNPRLVVWFRHEHDLLTAQQSGLGEPYAEGLSICPLGIAFGWRERARLTTRLRAALMQFAGEKYI